MSRKAVIETEPAAQDPTANQQQLAQGWTQSPQGWTPPPQGGAIATGPPPDLPPADKEVAPPEVSQKAITSLGNLIDPNAVLGTHFTGPLLSGPKTPNAAGILPVPGVTPLIKRAQFTFAVGNFNIPITFPPSSILLVFYTMIQQSFNGTTPTLSLNTDVTGASHFIGPIDLTAAPTLLSQNFTGILGSSWTAYLQLAMTGATQGNATAMILYSVPGK